MNKKATKLKRERTSKRAKQRKWSGRWQPVNNQQINLQLNTLTHTCELACANCVAWPCAWLDGHYVYYFALCMYLIHGLVWLLLLLLFVTKLHQIWSSFVYTHFAHANIFNLNCVLVAVFLFVCFSYHGFIACPFIVFSRSKSKLKANEWRETKTQTQHQQYLLPFKLTPNEMFR